MFIVEPLVEEDEVAVAAVASPPAATGALGSCAPSSAELDTRLGAIRRLPLDEDVDADGLGLGVGNVADLDEGEVVGFFADVAAAVVAANLSTFTFFRTSYCVPVPFGLGLPLRWLSPISCLNSGLLIVSQYLLYSSAICRPATSA